MSNSLLVILSNALQLEVSRNYTYLRKIGCGLHNKDNNSYFMGVSM